MKVSAYRITAQEIIKKKAQPLPGVSKAPASTPAPTRTAPVAPSSPSPDMAQEKPSLEPAKGPQPTSELQTLIQTLQTEFFSDEKMSTLSDHLTALIPMVGPEQSEKLAKVYAKFMEASAILKANLAALGVMVAPQAAQMEQLQQMFQEQEGLGNNNLKIGPLT